jgi:hypothetical protein
MSVAANVTPDQAQEIIYSFLRNSYGLGDQVSKIITAQSGHETAGWTSNVYESLNNCFGYGYSGGTYYGYNSIEDSVTDLVNWLSTHVTDFQNITDPDVYAQALKDNSYYTDTETNYAAGIARWFNNNLALSAAIGVGGILIISLIIFLLVRKH